MIEDSSHIYGRMLIDGELVDSQNGSRMDSIDPADETVMGSVPVASASDVNRAVEAASRAQHNWHRMGAIARGKKLSEVAAALRSEADEILRIEVRDTGNTLSKMGSDVSQAADTIDFFAGLATEIKGETIPASADNLHLTLREPYGVVGRIVPFNHPVKFVSHAIAAPLMAGNAVVVKPPEQSPLSAVKVGEICRDILPPGVVNILTGSGLPTGDEIVRHSTIKRIAFTGSVTTGRAIQVAAAESGVKHITLELGGKNPLIAFPDINPAEIAEAALAGMNFSWQGQSCGSTSRLLLHESLYDEVLDRILDSVAKIKVGHPLDLEAQMGPLNSERHYRRVCSMIQSGIDDGATLAFGGKRPKGELFKRGYWLQPTVFCGVTPDMLIGHEEIFGPVLSIFKWRGEKEAFEIANSTEYGLTASIWTNDLKAAMRAVREVKSGYVWVNGASGHFYGTPFGGMKSSGLGREEGLDELLSYTETKSVHFMNLLG